MIGQVNSSLYKDQLFESSIKTYRLYVTEAAFNKGIIDTIKDVLQGVFVEIIADIVRVIL